MHVKGAALVIMFLHWSWAKDCIFTRSPPSESFLASPQVYKQYLSHLTASVNDSHDRLWPPTHAPYLIYFIISAQHLVFRQAALSLFHVAG